MDGTLHLIPTTLGEYEPAAVLPAPLLEQVRTLKHFVVEETRTARRFLSAAGLKGHIGELTFRELNEHTSPAEVDSLLDLFHDEDGHPCDVGLLSEAGLPAVADPGALLVALCHRQGIRVVPHTGPSSLMLALMASGLNGQQFAFRGYLPAKPEERKKCLRALEKDSARRAETQIFIETPYRNDAMFADLLETLSPSVRLCVAADLTLPDEFIRTQSVREWRSAPVRIGKRPCVFLFLTPSNAKQ